MLRLIVLLIASSPTLALAQVGTTTTSTSGIPLDGLLAAVSAGDWPLAAGFAIMIAVWVLRKLGVLDKIKLGSKWGIRASTLVLAVLYSVAVGLIGGMSWFEIVEGAMQATVAAVGGWEFIGKLVRDVTGGSNATGDAPPPSGGA